MAIINTLVTKDGKLGCTTCSKLPVGKLPISDFEIVERGSFFNVDLPLPITYVENSLKIPELLSGTKDGFASQPGIGQPVIVATGDFPIALTQIWTGTGGSSYTYGEWRYSPEKNSWVRGGFASYFPNPITSDYYFTFVTSDPVKISNAVICALYYLEYGKEYLYRPNQITLKPYSTTSNYFSVGEIDPDVPINPFEPGGNSGEGGGGGSFDDDSDQIPDSSLPTISSANTGFTRIYNPSLSQVQDLARYLWTDDTVIETIWNHIKQFFENPMEAIIGFNLVPCAVPNGGIKNFALMYIDTGVQMTVAANQFVDVDCGTLEIKEYFGSALDYSPYTKISCFLPFIGTVQLNTDEVMKSTLQVKYRIDICSGSCVAKILVGGSVLYQYSGHCAIPIPISAADFSSYVSAAVSVAKLAIGAAVGGGMGALMAGADNPVQQTNQIVTTTQTTETGRNPATGRQITLGTKTTVETRESPADQSSTQASFSGIVASNISNTVGQIMTAKPHVEHSGSFSGNTGYLGVRRPYVIIQRPNMCMPAQYQQFNGFPSMITETLSSLKGFTRVQQVQLTEMSATNPEQAEILEFLKSGVII